jgi:glycosyltransferase involved in cell wall biosynthesis
MPDRKRKLLIVSYYYPPAGGIGLPGCMRVVKFVKYLKDWDISVLTVLPNKYPDYFDLDYPMTLPLRNERIHHTSVTDIFQKMVRIRSKVIDRNKALRNGAGLDDGTTNGKAYPARPDHNHGTFDIFHKVKDFIHDLCYFPDHASPWIPNAILAGRNIIREEKPDLIFATGMPWSALVIAHVLSRFTGVPYICDFRDPWIDNPFHQTKGHLLDRLNVYLEKTVVKKSVLVTANTAGLKNGMLRRYPYLPKEKIVELPNGYDPDDFVFGNSGIEDANKKRTLTMAHAGFLYGERDPSPILHAISLAYDRHRYGTGEIEFIQIGSLETNFRESMEKYVELGYAQSLGQIPHRKCIETLRNADVLVIIQQGTETQIPSKVYEYVCLNKPILTITQKGGALWELLEKNKFGYLFEPHDVQKISEKIHEYYMRKKANGCLKEEYPGRFAFDIAHITDRLSAYMTDICTEKAL